MKGKIHYILIILTFFLVIPVLPEELALSEENPVISIRMIREILSVYRTGLTYIQQGQLSRTILTESKKYRIDPLLILSIIKTESSFYNRSVSKVGAKGLMQIRHITGRFVANEISIKWEGDKTLFDPVKNVRIGIHYFLNLILHFRDYELAIIGYINGPTYVRDALQQGKVLNKNGYRKIINAYREMIGLE